MIQSLVVAIILIGSLLNSATAEIQPVFKPHFQERGVITSSAAVPAPDEGRQNIFAKESHEAAEETNQELEPEIRDLIKGPCAPDDCGKKVEWR